MSLWVAEKKIQKALESGASALDLEVLGLSALPESIGQLAGLQTLSLGGNQLSALPESIGQLAGLQGLYLDGNQLSALPESIGQLAGLQRLNLQGNQLSALPESIGQLAGLQVLHLDGNRLSALPESIGQLAGLQRLFLHGNPQLGLPEEVLGPTSLQVARGIKPKQAQAILTYYFRTRGALGKSLNEFKLIVVGRGGAGKTSLIKRLNGEEYDSKEPETHGITIQSLNFDSGHGPVVSRVWDFGGQVVLHSMHEFFLTARSLYLLVLGERDDMLERDAAYWLQLIRSYAGAEPVVVALNKSRGRQRQFDRETLEANYGPILGWIHTECSWKNPKKAGIEELRRALTAAIDGPHMESARRKFPHQWFSVKSALESMNRSYLDYGAYVKKCNSAGITEESEQTRLAADLHDLGVALNYGNDPRLRETSVLKPDWLANGIYAVLRANDLDQKLPTALNKPLAEGGIVTAESMALIHKKAQVWEILKAKDYPAEKRAFLLRLMSCFHLSYPLDDTGMTQLVPTLLPPEPPAGAEEPEGEDRTRLRYEFEVVPAPLLPWFIARTFSLIPGRLHWRRGTMLVYGEARSRVWTTQDERFVYVTTAGVAEDRVELITMIRSTFRDLYQGYRSLKVTEQWEHEGEWVPRKTLERFGKLEAEESTESDAFPADEGVVREEPE